MSRAQEKGITEFPYREYDKYNRLIYYETSYGSWYINEFYEFDNKIYNEESNGDGFFELYKNNIFQEIFKKDYKIMYKIYKRNLFLEKLLNE